MRYQNFAADYTIQKRKRRGPGVYLEAKPSIEDAKPSDIMVLFPLPLL
jgi:hypothetical protein